MIELVIENTYGGTFDPWDVIDVYENGSHAAKYYVSSASESQPNSNIVVSGQDNSKRLSDYFITDSYLIDYPSYTRYWIELFLTEVGINYTFLTNESGSLLSNNTSLGLGSAYDQVMTLLQMSGWYITFNAGGTAIIGKLDIDSAKSRGSLGKSDIIEIKVDKNDRMYRNRVVVWGNGDPETARWVFADVRKPTKWDYDSRDLRTILISNSSIPTVIDAFMLANQALTEFARLNVEKFLTVEDARDIRVGEVVKLSTKVYTGKALVTTFGVSMSRSGLVSNIACDERCPRLFGFYNPGGYVYVGTFGSGIWRKHILDYSNGVPSGVVLSGLATNTYSGGWFDVSEGLNDLNVTDLDVNNGVLACVTSSGELYFSTEDAATYSGIVWSGIVLSGLQVTYSGALIEDTIYSGLMGRACIIDRDTNFLRYAVDTGSGINYGDFLMETDPTGLGASTLFQYTLSGYIIGSGIIPSGRSWIMDVNPYDGSLTEAYSVNVSGGFNFFSYDIENDGTSDFLSVMTYGSGLIPQYLVNAEHSFTTNFTVTSQPYIQQEYGLNTKASLAYSGYPNPVKQLKTEADWGAAGGIGLYTTYAVYDYTPVSPAYIAWGFTGISSTTLQVAKFESVPGDVITTSYDIVLPTNYGTLLYVNRLNDTTYQYYFYSSGAAIRKISWNIITNAVDVVITGYIPVHNTHLVRSGIFYSLHRTTTTYGFTVSLSVVNLETGDTTTSELINKTGDATVSYGIDSGAMGLAPYDVYDVAVVVPFYRKEWITALPHPRTYNTKFYHLVQTGAYGGSSETLIYDYGNHSTTPTGGESTVVIGAAMQVGSLNAYRPFFRYAGSVGGVDAFTVTDLLDYTKISSSDSGNHLGNYDRIYNLGIRTDIGLGLQHRYSGHMDYEFDILDPQNLDVISTISNPSGYFLYDNCGVDSANRELFFAASTYSGSFASNYLDLISINDFGQVTRIEEGVGLPGQMIGNVRVQQNIFEGAPSDTVFTFVKPNDIEGVFPVYEVLKRDNDDFAVIKSGIYRDRLDLSIYSPLVTMGREISSTETFFISQDGEILNTLNPSMSGLNLGSTAISGSMLTLGVEADDFRYSDFEDTIESGTSRRIFVVYSGAVGSTDIYSLSTFSGEFFPPSGQATRIEMSNFSLPDQYVFVSVSGYTTVSGDWGFFQKSPSYSGYNMTSSGVFVDYSSGYPQARTTIIRLDNSI
jgi:hypothetical protein